jgi:hypothetical protein
MRHHGLERHVLAASVNAKIVPLSSLGMKPLGMITKQ